MTLSRRTGCICGLGLLLCGLLLHLVSLPPTLEDLDSVNFALGVRDFDVARHQPHPPGYPAYIALAKSATAALRAVGVAAPEVAGLAVLSALGWAGLGVALFLFFRGLDKNARVSAVGTALTLSSPLCWFAAVRPLSDIVGLLLAVAALAALVAGMRSRWDAEHTTAIERTLLLGGFLAGVAVGFRSQATFLVMPLLAWAVLAPSRRVPLRTRALAVAACAAGILAWVAPLIVASGGPSAYLAALGAQADEDLTGVVMLWTHRNARTAVQALLHSFVRPWDAPLLAGIVAGLAAGGAVLLAARRSRAAALLAVAFAPYAVFHLLFQETVTIRYALPLVPPVAYLAAVAIAAGGARPAAAITAALCVACLWLAVPATLAFARVPSPIFGLLSEVRLFEQRGASPVVAMHRRVFTESRRARLWAGDLPGSPAAPPRDYEWLELTRRWRDGHQGDTWFLADPSRTDLALIDAAQRRTREYRWPFRGAVYVGGTRPNEVDWHIYHRPGWFLEQGWALTPEVAGIAEREGGGPDRRPSIGWIRRRSAAAVMTIGGRHLGAPGDPPVRIVGTIDGRPALSFEARPGFFLQFVDLPDGTLAGADGYARLEIRAEASGGGAPARTALEQFNLQPADVVQFGFDDGWYEPEHNPSPAGASSRPLSQSWRWASERAVVRVHNAGHPVTVRAMIDSPLRYFADPPRVRLLAGDRVLAEIQPSSDFTLEADVPVDALRAARGRLTIETDRAYVAGEREGTADARRLALRVFSMVVRRQSS